MENENTQPTSTETTTTEAREELYQRTQDELINLYEASRRWNDLIKILTQKAENTEDRDARIQIYYRIANLWSCNLGFVKKSIDPLNKIIELDPTQRPALQQLHEFYEQRRDWANLYNIISKEAEVASESEKSTLLKRQAEIAEKYLHSTEKTIESRNELSARFDPGEAIAAAPQNTEATVQEPTGKGSLGSEILMGLSGEIISGVIALIITLCLEKSFSCHGDACMGNAIMKWGIGFPCLFAFFSIPIVSECVRYAGISSGGHKKRKTCYLATSSIFVLMILFLLLSLGAMGGFASYYFLIAAGSPIIILVAAIMGYRSDATSDDNGRRIA